MSITDELLNQTQDLETVSVHPYKNGKCFADARSAAFYAMGLAKKTDNPVILLISGEYLASIYTAITETWFQKAKVLVIALFERFSDVKTSWIDRCVLANNNISHDERELLSKYIENNLQLHGPSLISVVTGKKSEEKAIDYGEAISIMSKKDTVIAYYPTMKKDCVAISPNYKYGVISKYIGSCVAGNNGTLFCHSDVVLTDINVFRTRYKNELMKIAIWDSGSLANVQFRNWLVSCGWNVRETTHFDEKMAHWLTTKDGTAKVLLVQEKH